MSDSFATPWTGAHQAPLSIGFSKQEYWSRLPFPSPEDIPNPGIEITFPVLAGGFFTTEPPGKLHKLNCIPENSYVEALTPNMAVLGERV